jgi:ABC-type transport system involved in cytochrome c biogenesis permease subunit
MAGIALVSLADLVAYAIALSYIESSSEPGDHTVPRVVASIKISLAVAILLIWVLLALSVAYRKANPLQKLFWVFEALVVAVGFVTATIIVLTGMTQSTVGGVFTTMSAIVSSAIFLAYILLTCGLASYQGDLMREKEKREQNANAAV